MSAAEHVEVPPKLAGRPRDRRGYPIPWMVQLDAHGLPDFRVTNADRWVLAVKAKLCAMCGDPLGRHLAFIGGPVSFRTRLFTDLPMHKECGLYAIQVCPFLAAPSFRYATTLPSMDGVRTELQTTEMVPTRPDRFFIATTHRYEVIQTSEGSVLAQAAPWEWFQWWRHGAIVDGQDAEARPMVEPG